MLIYFEIINVMHDVRFICEFG